MTHQIFKVLDLYYIHIDDKHRLCPLADYLCEFALVEVLEVRYNPQAEQGVIIARCEHEDGEKKLNYLVEQYKTYML